MFCRLSCFSSPAAADEAPPTTPKARQRAPAPVPAKPASQHTRSYESYTTPPTPSSARTTPPRQSTSRNSRTPTRREAPRAQRPPHARGRSAPIIMAPIASVLPPTPPMLRATTTESRQHLDAAALAASAHMTLDEHGQWQHRSLYCGSGSRPLSLAIDAGPLSRPPSSQGHYPTPPASAASHTRIEHLAPAFSAHVSRANSFVSPPSPRVLKNELPDDDDTEKNSQPLSREALSSSGDSSASSEQSADSSATNSPASSSNTLPTPESSCSNDGAAGVSSDASHPCEPSDEPPPVAAARMLAPIDTSHSSPSLELEGSTRRQRSRSERGVRFALDPSPIDAPLLQAYPRSPLPPPQYPRQHAMQRGGRQHPWALPAPPPPPALMGSTWGAGAYAPPAPERKTTPARILSSLRPSSAHGHYSSSREHSPTRGGRSLNASPAASVRARGARPTSWTASAQDAEALAAALAAQKKQRRHSVYGSESLRPPSSPSHNRRAVSASTVPSIYGPHEHAASSSEHRPRNNEPRWCETPTLLPPRSVQAPSPSADTPNFSRPAAYLAPPEPWLHTPCSPARASPRRSHPPSSSRLQVHVPVPATGVAEAAPRARRTSLRQDSIVPRSLSAALSQSQSPQPSQAYVAAAAPAHAPQRRLSKSTTLPEVVEHPPTPRASPALRPARPALLLAGADGRPSLHSLALASHGHARRSLASSA